MPAFNSCNSAYKTKNLGDFFYSHNKIRSKYIFIAWKFHWIQWPGLFSDKKKSHFTRYFSLKMSKLFQICGFCKKSTLLSRYPHRNPVTPGMFNDSLSRTRHIKFSRMSKFYKLENQHQAITILHKEDRYFTISN